MVLIVDIRFGGHHATYINKISKQLLNKNIDFMVLYPKPEELDVNIMKICRVKKLQLKYFGFFENSYRFKTIALWLDLIYSFWNIKNEYKYTTVFFAWVDDLRFGQDYWLILKIWIGIVKIFGPKSWSGLYFHPTHFRKKHNDSYTKDLIFSIKNCSKIFVLDTGISESLSKKINKPVYDFPDITDVSVTNQCLNVETQIKTKANGRKIISLLGMLSKRKGILQLLKVANKLSGYFFVFAGPIDEKTFSSKELELIESFRQSQPNNCFFHFHSLEDGNEFNRLVIVSDIIYAAYLNFPHSSNLLVKAAFFKKPVIVSNGYYMDEIVRKYKLGLSLNPEDLDEILETIHKINDFCVDEFLQQCFYLENSEIKLEKIVHKIIKE